MTTKVSLSTPFRATTENDDGDPETRQEQTPTPPASYGSSVFTHPHAHGKFGCIVSATTPTHPLTTSSGSISSRSERANPSITRSASYRERLNRRSTTRLHPTTQRVEDCGDPQRRRRHHQRAVKPGADQAASQSDRPGQQRHNDGVGDGAGDDPIDVVEAIAEDGEDHRQRQEDEAQWWTARRPMRGPDTTPKPSITFSMRRLRTTRLPSQQKPFQLLSLHTFRSDQPHDETDDRGHEQNIPQCVSSGPEMAPNSGLGTPSMPIGFGTQAIQPSISSL